MQSLSDVEFPSLPHVALRLVNLCAEPDISVAEVVSVVSLDAALSARLLKVANSAFYSQRRSVDTLQRAAVVLGLNYLKVVALGFHLVNFASSWRHLPIDVRRLSLGNLLRACLARQFARYGGKVTRDLYESAFLVGLLQDLAVPVISLAVGDKYKEAAGGEGLYTTELTLIKEREWVDEDHASLAGWLCNDWHFPPNIVEAIRQHHVKPSAQAMKDPARALECIAHWVGAVPFEEAEQGPSAGSQLGELAQTAFAIDVEKFAEIFTSAASDFETLRPVFGKALPAETDVTAVMRRAKDLILGLDPSPTNSLALPHN